MAGAGIDLLVLGVSHRTAPVAVRERLAIVPDAVETVLGAADRAAVRARGDAAVDLQPRRESTPPSADVDGAVRALGEALAQRAGVPALELAAHLYEWREAEAVHHLFRVASSLDSLVIGEPQILGQVKQAHDAAVRHGTAGATLNACFQRAFRVARRVRRETEIARNPVSVSSVAIELARQVFGDFRGRHVLVVGAGKMSELAAKTLRTHGATLTVVNRTRSRADELAARFGAAARDWNDLPAALIEADIVIASTGAQRPVLTLPIVKQAQRARRGRPLFMLDIAVPRDVEPEVASLNGIYLADIDDLQKVAAEHREGRQSEAAEAEAMVRQELDRFLKAWRGRQLAPTVTALRAHVLGLAQAEAQRVTAAMPGLGERERRALADLAESIAKKLLHTPQMALRQDDGEDAISHGDGRAAAVRAGGGRPGAAGRGARIGDRAQAGHRRRQEGGRPMTSTNTGMTVVLGTRGSALALWQAREVARLLRAAHPGLEVREQIIVTTGDRGQSAPPATLVEGKGAWVAEIEAALRAGTIDLAVHSLKDVPAELAEGLALVAIPTRADPRDALVSRSGAGIDGLAPGSRVGTSSLRRVCQLRAARRDLQIEILRGNVDTRLRKVSEGRRRRRGAGLRGPRSARLLGAHRRAHCGRAHAARDRAGGAGNRGAPGRRPRGGAVSRARRRGGRSDRRRRARITGGAGRRLPDARGRPRHAGRVIG